ncbi:MAG: hypothetical protein HY928_06010 [Elusimicrobia bacterium]|nr:hypothetical protein [Elusimicrobiota bacterium]
MKTMIEILAALLLAAPVCAQEVVDRSFSPVRPELADGLAPVFEPRLAALEARLAALTPGLYHPPQEVGVLLSDFKELGDQAYGAGVRGPLMDRILKSMEACDQRLDESLDKDGVVLEYALRGLDAEVRSFLGQAEAASADGSLEGALPALRERYLRRYHGQDGLLLAMYVSLYRGSTSAGYFGAQGSTRRSLDTKVNPAAKRMAALVPKVKRLEDLLGLDPTAEPSRPMERRIESPEESMERAKMMFVPERATLRALGDEIGVAVEAYKPRLPKGLSGVKEAAPPAPVILPAEQEAQRFFKTPRGLYEGGTALDDELADRRKGYEARKKGETARVGDPYGRARLVHRQQGQTCAVVAQQQVLQELGLLPKGSAWRAERLLAREAGPQNDYEVNGAPWESWGRLLTERGVLVRTRADAPNSELEAAVKTGKLVIVDVDAGLLWRSPRFSGGGHAVVVTGAEVGRKDGKVKGYYINDSGTGEAARFVSAELMLSSFRKRRGRFIAVQ